MTLDRRHMIGSLIVLAGSIVYNVWVFTGGPEPASMTNVGAAPIDAAPAAPGGSGGGAAAFDPTQLRPLPDVALDTIPEWPRDPFASPRRVPEVVQAEAAPEPIVEADPVVASILYSPDRRLAMIGGRIMGIGDRVGDGVIVEILPNAVIVESSFRGRRTLELRTPRTTVTRQ